MNQVEHGIVAILKPDKSIAGTGFLVGPDGLAVTCAHVILPINQQNSHPIPETVEVFFHIDEKEKPYTATILSEYWRSTEDGDVAFLRIKGPLPAGVDALRLGKSLATQGHEFETYGFPTATRELTGDGIIRAKERLDERDYLRLDSKIMDRGYSGCPIYDRKKRRVVGMMALINEPDSSGRMRDISLAIPTETLAEICQELEPSDICPYRGLDVFTKEDREFYRGRDKIIKGAATKLSQTRYLEVVGPSGSGKSSLVRAGLVPKLEEGTIQGLEKWDVVIIRPKTNPFEELRSWDLDDDDHDLVMAVSHWLETSSAHKRLVLVIDQFEELFTACSPEIQQKFIAALSKLLDASNLHIKVIITMRDDFLSQFSQQAQLLFNRIDHQTMSILPQIDRGDLEAMILQPAEIVGLNVNSELKDAIINDLLKATEKYNTTDTTRTALLPLLEFTLKQLWKEQCDGELTLKAYNDINGVTGSLRQWATDTFNGIPADQQKLVIRIFEALVYVGDERQGSLYSRRRVPISQLVYTDYSQEITTNIVDKLIKGRLLTAERSEIPQIGLGEVEIIHDALIYEWDLLKGWLKKDEQFKRWEQEITERAQKWQNLPADNPAKQDQLLPRSELQEARFHYEEYLQDHRHELDLLIKDYIDASQARQDEQDAQREQHKRELQAAEAAAQAATLQATRWTQIAAGVIALAVIVGMVAALLIANAQRNTIEAKQQADNAQSTVTAANATLTTVPRTVTPMELTLQAGSAQIAHIQAQVTQIVSQVNVQTAKAESLRLAVLAAGEANNSSTAMLLGIQALKSAYTTQADVALQAVIANGYLWRTDLKAQVARAVFSPDGRTIVIGSIEDGSISRRDAQTGKSLSTFPTGTQIHDIDLSPDGKYILTADRDVLLWDIQGHLQQKFVSNSGSVINSIRFSPDGKYIAAGLDDNTALLWTMGSSKPSQQFTHKGAVKSVAFSPDSKYLLTGSTDKTARLWDIVTGNERQSFTGQQDEVTTVAFSPDGQFVLTGTGRKDKSVRLWDTMGGSKQQFSGHTSQVTSVAFSPDGQTILTGSEDQTARLWDVKTGNQIRKFAGHTSLINSVTFSPDGELILTGSADNTVALWTRRPESATYSFPSYTEKVTSSVFSPNGKVLLVTDDKTVQLIDPTTGTRLCVLNNEHTDTVLSAAFSPDSMQILTGSKDHQAILWDVASCKPLTKIISTNNPVRTVSFSPDGNQLLIGSGTGNPNDNVISLYDRASWSIVANIHGILGFGKSAAYSPDGSLLAIGDVDNKILLWDVAKRKMGKVFEGGHQKPIYSLMFSPDGQQVLSGSVDGTALLWDVNTGREISQFVGDAQHKIGINDVAFSPDGRHVIAGDANGITRVWDIATSAVIRQFNNADGAAVYSVAFSPSGQQIVTGSVNGIARLWDIDPNSLVAEACSRLSMDLNDQERGQFEISDKAPTCEQTVRHAFVTTWTPIAFTSAVSRPTATTMPIETVTYSSTPIISVKAVAGDPHP